MHVLQPIIDQIRDAAHARSKLPDVIEGQRKLYGLSESDDDDGEDDEEEDDEEEGEKEGDESDSSSDAEDDESLFPSSSGSAVFAIISCFNHRCVAHSHGPTMRARSLLLRTVHSGLEMRRCASVDRSLLRRSLAAVAHRMSHAGGRPLPHA